MTTPSLSRLTPRERQVYWRLLAPGTTETVEDIADAFGVQDHVIQTYATKIRAKAPGLVTYPLRRRAKVVDSDVVPERHAALSDDHRETPSEAFGRVRDDMAAGRRCWCRLLKPCFDHELTGASP